MKHAERPYCILDMIIGINEPRTLTKHILCKFKCNFDSRKCNSNQMWNYNKFLCECKNLRKHYAWEKDYILNSISCTCENNKCLGSIIKNSMIIRDKIIKLTNPAPLKTIPIKSISKTFIFSTYFLLVTIARLIAVSIYCNLMKYLPKQKYFLPCHDTSNKFLKNDGNMIWKRVIKFLNKHEKSYMLLFRLYDQYKKSWFK